VTRSARNQQDEVKLEIEAAVMQEREGEWEIVAFHNAPVQKREEDSGFVILVEGLDTEQGGKEMIKDVPLTGVFVNDQDAALDFYTNKLGLEKVQDESYGEGGARWITVSPVGYRTRIVLKKAEHDYEKALVGRSDGAPILTLGTNDVRAAYELLRERGVRFLGEPYRYPWGIGALLLDQDGSPILLQQESGER
jgi:catechol 2,3-dioxygenase-like lactoylglutathione lyase family enzyme